MGMEVTFVSDEARALATELHRQGKATLYWDEETKTYYNAPSWVDATHWWRQVAPTSEGPCGEYVPLLRFEAPAAVRECCCEDEA